MARAEVWNLVTSAGRVDVIFAPTGTHGYEELVTDAVRYEVFGVEIAVAPLERILQMKEAADRAQDRQDAVLLRAMLDARPER